jgi:DNA-binding transcriptional MocR family regulator
MFSTRNAFSHFIRLNYSYPWTAQSEAALQRLGELVGEIGARAGKDTNMGERA